MTRNRIIPIFVPHLGCPHHCVFCNQVRIAGQERPASGDDVNRAIHGYSPDEYEVAFYGGSFTAIPKSMQEELLSAAEGYRIRLSTRPDAIDDDILLMLKSHNVRTIELGAQSMDDEVLKITRRGHTSQDVINASVLIKKYGFSLGLQMMTGLPGDTFEKCVKTAEQIIALKPDCVRIYPTVIVKDTDLYDMYLRGEYREHTVEDAVKWCSVILPMFEKANINVIRLGLNPTDDLSDGDAVAGAYHPALGELVRSRILRNELDEEIASRCLEGGETVALNVPGNRLSQYTGQHRCNIEYLEKKYGIHLKLMPTEK